MLKPFDESLGLVGAWFGESREFCESKDSGLLEKSSDKLAIGRCLEIVSLEIGLDLFLRFHNSVKLYDVNFGSEMLFSGFQCAKVSIIFGTMRIRIPISEK